MAITKEKLDAAKKQFRADVIATVIEVVELADPDGAYTQFEDEGMFEHAECVEFLYFEC